MTEIKQMATAPREERETIISYDRQTETWHIYTDEPKHARKYEKYVAHPQRKGYNSAGQLIMLEGDIDKGTVSISKKVRLTEKQKEKQRQVLQKARISNRVNLQTEKININ